MKKLEDKFNKILLTEMAFSIIYLLLGVFIAIKSEIANSVAGILVGIFFLISGFINIYTFIDKSKIRLFRYNIWTGILEVLLGIFIMLNPLTLLDILNISLGIWILVEGINRMILYIDMKKIQEESSKIFLVSSLLLIFMGVMIILNPFRSIVITRTIGIFIILYNVISLNNLVLLKRRSKKFLKLFK